MIALEMHHFDDLRLGHREKSAEFTAIAEEMLAYAKEYDPFPIHTDHEYG
jgi:acyl dehydratase